MCKPLVGREIGGHGVCRFDAHAATAYLALEWHDEVAAVLRQSAAVAEQSSFRVDHRVDFARLLAFGRVCGPAILGHKNHAIIGISRHRDDVHERTGAHDHWCSTEKRDSAENGATRKGWLSHRSVFPPCLLPSRARSSARAPSPPGRAPPSRRLPPAAGAGRNRGWRDCRASSPGPRDRRRRAG
jgi:hypothetical protein